MIFVAGVIGPKCMISGTGRGAGRGRPGRGPSTRRGATWC